jgi:hypothetical protein
MKRDAQLAEDADEEVGKQAVFTFKWLKMPLI